MFKAEPKGLYWPNHLADQMDAVDQTAAVLAAGPEKWNTSTKFEHGSNVDVLRLSSPFSGPSITALAERKETWIPGLAMDLS